MAEETLTVFALDLGYLRSGFAVVRQPGDQVLKHGVVQAEPYRASKVTDEIRVRRAKSAFDGLRLALYYADQDFGPLDAVTFEEPMWVGALLRRGQMSKDSVLALGQCLERLFLVLSLTGWAKIDPKTGKYIMRPVFRMDPKQWQVPFLGTARVPAGQTKQLVRRNLTLRMAENEDFEVSHLGDDEVDAVCLGLVVTDMLRAGLLSLT